MSGLVLVAANLKPKKLAGFTSNGMVLMASSSDHSIIEILKPDSSYWSFFYGGVSMRYYR